ncbi:MAG: serine/threonine protein kinase [Deltaproteobacteria bacterium]|nr:serine/threonine protein kinase [Deltaproteobacteria bacterium]
MADRRYLLHAEIGRGGTATVHLGTLVEVGSERTAIVAVKRLREGFTRDAQLVASLVDEAVLTTHIRHPNVVATIEVVTQPNDLFVVMEYVEGEALSRVLGRHADDDRRLPLPIVARIGCDVLRGLHAAHEATDETGRPLQIIHRDVSPQNVMIGTDGLAHVVDFGVAKAVGRLAQTKQGQIKGKLAYMSPEHLRGDEIDRRADVYASGVLLWEMLVGQRLFRGKNEVEMVGAIRSGAIDPPSVKAGAHVPPVLDAVVMKALSRDRALRFETAAAMADALEAAIPPASTAHLAAWASIETAEAVAAHRAAVTSAGTSPSVLTFSSSAKSFDDATTRVMPKKG